jgi:hypothetical protein
MHPRSSFVEISPPSYIKVHGEELEPRMIVRKVPFASLSIRLLGRMDFLAAFTGSTWVKVLVLILAFFNVKNFPFAWHVSHTSLLPPPPLLYGA